MPYKGVVMELRPTGFALDSIDTKKSDAEHTQKFEQAVAALHAARNAAIERMQMEGEDRYATKSQVVKTELYPKDVQHIPLVQAVASPALTETDRGNMPNLADAVVGLDIIWRDRDSSIESDAEPLVYVDPVMLRVASESFGYPYHESGYRDIPLDDPQQAGTHGLRTIEDVTRLFLISAGQEPEPQA
jgi:hypothetical protein